MALRRSRASPFAHWRQGRERACWGCGGWREGAVGGDAERGAAEAGGFTCVEFDRKLVELRGDRGSGEGETWGVACLLGGRGSWVPCREPSESERNLCFQSSLISVCYARSLIAPSRDDRIQRRTCSYNYHAIMRQRGQAPSGLSRYVNPGKQRRESRD